ncbi:MAG: TlpA family protein disulfide reductase [Sphingobacteriales bacterium]
MKKLFASLSALFLIANSSFAQNTTLKVTLANSSSTSYHIWIPGLNLNYQKKGSFDVSLNASGTGTHQFTFNKPQYAYLMYASSDADSAKTWYYIFYLSPGDNINFKADFKSIDNGIVVTGKGSNNNQPLLSVLAGASVQTMYGDTLPGRIIAFANKHQADLKVALEKYIGLYKPSPDFVKNELSNIKYDAVYQYYEFKENNKYRLKDPSDIYKGKWKATQDSLFATIKLDNDEALGAINYELLIQTFMGREKEYLWTQSYKNPEAFFKEWYNTDVITGKKEFDEDEQNLLQEKIINHFFTHRSAEFLYGALFDNAMSEHNPENIVSIYDGFKQKYPNSEYISLFGPSIDTIRQQETKPLSADYTLVADNGTKLNTMEDLLALTKGKTVLLDMWGTWCGPCRNEIHDNGPALKAYFKGKGLDYFYVANRDVNHEGEWKKLIAYFDMKGTHILANANLSKDIMAKVKGTGYPTYVIIKKDGTYELSKAGYPMNRDVLIKQLEEALTMK